MAVNSGPTPLDALRRGRLAGAAALDLRGCGLTALPDEVLALADTLEHLDVSGNALTALPADLARFKRLKVLFCSDNRFTVLPSVLGRCPSLDIVGFKANQIECVPADALPPSLRWLILTDNRIAELPASLGHCAPMQKLMLAGNRLRALPVSIAQCQRLELLRLAANDFQSLEDAVPDALLALPHLNWLALGGNPWNDAQEQRALQGPVDGGAGRHIDWSHLRLGERLGEGASGVIHAAWWRPGGAAARDGLAEVPVAVKVFKAAMTSDGLPRSELAATLAAGGHDHLVAPLGRLSGHPAGAQGLVLQRIPAGHRALAAPPSLATCTRDVYPPGQRWAWAQSVAVARGVASALAHLHARGLQHADLYAHNLLVDGDGHALLSDFGAASFLPEGDSRRREALQRMDRRALAILVDELAQRSDDPAQVRSALANEV